ncbi:hypothetical protein [Vibrio sp. WXL210]|uniref:hypothetical protein n=1 Tax=Vibrio sp. WXL210 TaxID=3450709 RepID=UPI003EC79976
MKYLLLLLLVPLSISASEDQKGSSYEKRFLEISNYSSVDGVWEGKYTLQHVSQAFLDLVNEPINQEIAVRISVQRNSAKVEIQRSPGEEWEILDGQTSYLSDTLGWHVIIAREGGVWVERIWYSFSRTQENSGSLAVTRTVHNWYDDGDPKHIEYFSVFGEGKLLRD